MKRTMFEKYQSTKLHQSWATMIVATWLARIGIITPEIWLGAMTLAVGSYTWSSVQQHRIYGNNEGGGE